MDPPNSLLLSKLSCSATDQYEQVGVVHECTCMGMGQLVDWLVSQIREGLGMPRLIASCAIICAGYMYFISMLVVHSLYHATYLQHEELLVAGRRDVPPSHVTTAQEVGEGMNGKNRHLPRGSHQDHSLRGVGR